MPTVVVFRVAAVASDQYACTVSRTPRTSEVCAADIVNWGEVAVSGLHAELVLGLRAFGAGGAQRGNAQEEAEDRELGAGGAGVDAWCDGLG